MSRPPSRFDYHGPHAARPDEQAIQVQWMRPVCRADRLRIREHTCICTYPMYEFCTAAGLWFVRRHLIEGHVSIRESSWMSARAARELWIQILRGQAR